MQTAMAARTACTASISSCRRSTLGNIAGLAPAPVVRSARRSIVVKAVSDTDKPQAVFPINGDPFIGMLETPITSDVQVASFLSNLPAYRTGVSPLLRGTEVGLAHGFFLVGPFIKLGPLRNTEFAEKAGCLSGAGLVVILTLALTAYGIAAFDDERPQVGVKTLSGREVDRDPLQSSEGWANFTAGWLVGGLSGVAWAYILTQTLPYYQ